MLGVTVTEFQDGTFITTEVMGCQVHAHFVLLGVLRDNESLSGVPMDIDT